MSATATALNRGKSPAYPGANNIQNLSTQAVKRQQVSIPSTRWPHPIHDLRQTWVEAKVDLARTEQAKKLEAVLSAAPQPSSGIHSGRMVQLTVAGMGYHARAADNLPSQIDDADPFIFPSGQTYVFPPGQTPAELIPDPSKPCLNQDCPLTQAKISHHQGPYFHNGEARVSEIFGISNPPPDILEAWRRMFSGKRFSKVDEDKVITFAYFHAWLSDEVFEKVHEVGSWTQYTKDFYKVLIQRVKATKPQMTFAKRLRKL